MKLGMGEQEHGGKLRLHVGPCVEGPPSLMQDPGEADALVEASVETESLYFLGEICSA